MAKTVDAQILENRLFHGRWPAQERSAFLKTVESRPANSRMILNAAVNFSAKIGRLYWPAN
ncbi:hypothetical protein BpHYR1_019438, partial [Brachionus plicatilis]